MNNILLKRISNNQTLIKSYKGFLLKRKNNNCEKLFILTTAITRSNLHNVSFNNYKSIIPKDISINWIINIDYVKFPDISEDANIELLKTKDNIINIFSDYKNIRFTFILNEKGHFNKAVRNITNKTSDLIGENCKGILYLEDDWFVTSNFDLNIMVDSKKDILKLYIDTDPRKKLSFQPSIMKPHVWYLMFYNRLKNNNDTVRDPEKICQITNEIDDYNLIYQKLDYFKDIGRDTGLNDDNTIRGWYQKTRSLSENISLTYIYIDRLLKAIIYLQSTNNKLNKKNLENNIVNYLQNIFMGEIISKILIKYRNNEEEFFNFYLESIKNSNNKNITLKEAYHGIDKLI